jgi:exonuclease III
LDTNDDNRPERRTALIATELKRYSIDIAALSETRFSDEGSLNEEGEGYTFFWKGYPAGQPRLHGVGFAIKNTILRKIPETPTAISERLISIRIPLIKNSFATIISAYAPTLTSPEVDKDAFYDDLERVIRNVPRNDRLILCGDFNARVGRDSDAWKGTIGKHGLGKMNENGQRLLSFCTENDLCITNTMFQQRDMYKGTWMHPRSKTWHLIDYFIVRRKFLKDVQLTRAMRGAECWTDHRLIRSTFRMTVRPPLRRTQPAKRLNVRSLSDLNTRETLQNNLTEALINLPIPDVASPQSTFDSAWEAFINVTSNVSLETLGTAPKSKNDWFDEAAPEIHDLLKRKNEAHDQFISRPTRHSHNRWKELRAKTQKKLRELQNEWWLQKARKIQEYADANQIHEFYDAIKAIFGPSRRSMVPVRSADGSHLFKTQSEILTRWAEHFSNLLNHVNPVDPSIIDELPKLPILKEMDAEPTFEETKQAIARMKNRKSPGSDAIPGELYKYGGIAIQSHLHQFILHCWRSATIPNRWKHAAIITIYKKKGDRSECGNSRGISLLDVAGKVLTRIMLSRLLTHFVDRIVPETQCGFRADRSTVDMFFVAKLLLEKGREQQRKISFAFIDLAKAFDTVNRDLLWRIMERYGCPPLFLTLLQKFHHEMTAFVSCNGTNSDPFDVNVGVKQGCVLAPVLFNIYLVAVTLTSRHQMSPSDGIQIRYRFDGGLFNLRRLKATTRTRTTTIYELQYADDAASTAHDPENLQHQTSSLQESYTRIGLRLNAKKTETLQFDPDNALPTQIQLGNDTIRNVSSFCHLGSILSDSCHLDEEIQHRISAASSAFGRLKQRVFLNRNLKIMTKISVYNAVCISTLLYGCEAWTPYRRHFRTLEAFNIRCLQQVLGLTWKDRVPHVEILRKVNCLSIECTILQRQLRWLGHVLRMEDNRLPKIVLHGELATGQRPRGGPKKRYLDHIKSALRAFDINPTNLEILATDRSLWRTKLKNGSATFEANRRIKSEERRRKRLEPQPNTNPDPHPCHLCQKICNSRIGLVSHIRSHEGRRRRGR